MKKLTRLTGKPAIELLEESIATLRQCGLMTWLCYYLGSIPCVLAFLYFWSEMSAGAYAESRLAGASLGMAAGFIWMKCWQSVFMNRLLVLTGMQEPVCWTPGRVLRLIVQQTFVQSTALFLLPLAAIATLPLGWTYAFYQSFLIDGSGEPVPVRVLLERSIAQAKLWPMQNHLGLSFLSLSAGVVCLNAFSLLWLAPGLAKSLFDIETLFSRNPWSAINSTVLMIAFGLTYLVVGPVAKTFYVLRCFHGRSVRTGDDLKVAIRRIRKSVLCLLGGLMFLSGGNVQAANPQQLDQSIDKVLTRPEYAWRMPRVASADAAASKPTLLGQFATAIKDALKACFRPVKKWVKQIAEWLEKFMQPSRPPKEKESGMNWKGAFEKGVYALCALVVIAAGVIAWRGWKRRLASPQVIAEPVRAVPDLRSENVTADELPQDRWIELAEKLAAQGEFRLSLRALYLAGLAHLGSKELVTIARSKSNKEFRHELTRRARLQTELIAAFGESVNAFETVWYGTGEATPETLKHYTANLQRMIQAC